MDDAMAGQAPAPQKNGAHQFSFNRINGGALPLDGWRGKVLMVVNTASQCGFTPQYKGLEALWQAYKDYGLVVLGVPSNDFGGQEPGREEEIAPFCEGRYAVSFPLAAKETVKGEGAHPFYRWAAEEAGFLGRPRWNFHKYLIGRNGAFVDWFSTVTPPESGRLRDRIESMLG